MIEFLVVVLLIGLVLWGTDRHLCLKDVEKDLRLHLESLEILRDVSVSRLRVHFEAQIALARALIQKHFKL